jgi:hypothetical protein
MNAELSLVSPTNTHVPQAAPLKRCAIVGTAQSWKQTPWHDATLEVWCLNDAYLIGVPKADRWYDLHPLHQMHFRGGSELVVSAKEVPVGSYVRPQGHLDWLRSRPIPVYLAEARPDFPTSKAFPTQAVLDYFAPYWPMRLQRDGSITAGKDYEVSTPSWMLMQAIMEGYQEIHIYGIHLATQWEYLQQRPNFEFLLGIAAGKGIKIVLPQSTPICRGAYRYAFDPKIDLPVQAAELEIAKIKEAGLVLRRELETLPWHAWQRKKAIAARLQYWDVALLDAKAQHQRASLKVQGVVS